MPRPHERGLLVYAGRVGQVLDWADYEEAFRGRDDAVYRPGPLGFERLRPDYHESGRKMEKDLSAPVLVFERDTFWYFGNSPQLLPHRLLPLAAAGRGHRVRDATEEDCEVLETWLRANWSPGVYGQPRDRRTPRHAGRASRSRCD